MQLANQANQLSLFGHFCFQKNKMATTKIQIRGFKTAVHKPVSDVTGAMSIISTVYGANPLYRKHFRSAAAPSTRQSEISLNHHLVEKDFLFWLMFPSLLWHFVANSFQIDCLKSRFTERVIHLHLLWPIKQLLTSPLTPFVALCFTAAFVFPHCNYSVSLYYGYTFSK